MKYNKMVIGVILILIIGIGAFIAFQFRSTNMLEYNGFTIYEEKRDGLQSYQIQFFREGEEQPFIIHSRYHPQVLETISVPTQLRKELIKEQLYITMEPTLSGKATIAFAEIDKYTENPFLFNLPTYPALVRKIEGNELPIITCSNVSTSSGVIMFKIGEKNQISNQEGCIIIEAQNEDELIKGADRLSLTLLEIMKE